MAQAIKNRSLFPPVWVMTLIALIALCWVAFQLKELVVLLVVGYTIAYVIDPWLSKLEQFHVRRTVGFFVVIGVLLIVLSLIVVTALPTLIKEYRELSEKLPTNVELFKEKFAFIVEWAKTRLPESFKNSTEFSPEEYIPTVSGETLNKILAALGNALLSGYSATMALLNLFLLPFIVFYLSVDFPHLRSQFLDLFPSIKRAKVGKIIGEIDMYVSSYVKGQFMVGFILFILYALGLGFIGVELWFLLAIIAGFGNMVPYLGFIAGIIFSSLMALATFGDWSHLFQVWGLFAVVQMLEGTFITPNIVGDKVGLSPLIVILALVAGGSLFGLLGIVLAVPAAAALKVLAKELHAWMICR